MELRISVQIWLTQARVVRPRVTLLGALVATIGLAHGCTGFGEERKIARRLDELAEAASVDGSETPVVRMASAARVGRYFTEDVTVDHFESAEPIRGRDAIVALATQARTAIRDLRIRFEDVKIELPTSDTATAHLTLVVSGRADNPNASTDARELRLSLRKVNDDWLVAQVQTVTTLKRPE